MVITNKFIAFTILITNTKFLLPSKTYILKTYKKSHPKTNSLDD